MLANFLLKASLFLDLLHVPVKLEVLHVMISFSLTNVSVWKFHLNSTKKPCTPGVSWGTKIARPTFAIALEYLALG